eukprot:NODE_1573_length_1109_cov_319.427894.p1 GENE.NODE_1573_length_1109_cov_319.427894~~NODE_1573_length_1109_cov_319.427894.p1  ORF type:complete len:294 (-),score=113.13 NODE_1573_length_1109_cov_319.427894:211-999(-)
MSSKNGEGPLAWKDIDIVLINNALLPRDPDRAELVKEQFRRFDSDGDDKIYFSEFLHLLDTLRAMKLDEDKVTNQELFVDCDKNGDGCLCLTEVSGLLAHLNIQATSAEDQMELKRLIDCVDADGSGDLTFDEFEVLVQAIQRRLLMRARSRQQVLARRLGFGEREVCELRRVFFELDNAGCGYLSVEQCRQALNTLRHRMSSEDLHGLIYKTSHGTGRLDFETFMVFLAEVAVPPQKTPADEGTLVAAARDDHRRRSVLFA